MESAVLEKLVPVLLLFLTRSRRVMILQEEEKYRHKVMKEYLLCASI
jgi:hypothetical protein